MTSLLTQLQNGEPIHERVVIVSAHPDDETLSFGGAMSLLTAASVVQLTDGGTGPAANWPAGVTSRDEYVSCRRAERETAWAVAGWSLPVAECGVQDQQAIQQAPELIRRLVNVLRGSDLVVTHPYEGGHPDHDAAAFVVQQACDRLGPEAPARYEFSSYHWNGETRAAGVFWRMTPRTSVRVTLQGDRLARKQRALAAYASQYTVIRWFKPAIECYRVAPRYDFTQPPSPPACLYERKGMMPSATWRAAAATAVGRQAVPA